MQANLPTALRICTLAIENQQLLSRSLDYGLLREAKNLRLIDTQLTMLLLHTKRLGRGTHYIWRTQDDKKVRASHAGNDDKIFAWDSPPPTGHPGEDFNCRCWAEPLGDNHYANQMLITPVNDNPDRWGNEDFVHHYIFGNGVGVTLQETGYLADIINFYAEHAIPNGGGEPGIYRRVEQQIIDKAIAVGSDHFFERFDNSYNFGEVLYTFRNSTVKGLFEGEVRRQDQFLVINGIITYDFIDEFEDPLSVVEILVQYEGWSREDAQRIMDKIPEIITKKYSIRDQWKTKFNATVTVNQYP